MPSRHHEASLLLFRNRPTPAAEVLHDVLGVETAGSAWPRRERQGAIFRSEPMAERALDLSRMTFAQAAALDPDHRPGELDAGVWVPMTKSTWRHAEVVVNIAVILKDYARRHPGWSVAAGDPGTKLRHDPDVLRGPDVAAVRMERRPTGRGEAGWLEGAPDLAVEVVGDAQPMGKMLKKATEYLAAGAKMVWVVDPEAEVVLVLTPPDHVRVLGPGEALDGGDALPGLRCEVAALFG
jgi:Uma2 family endonuclease